MDLFQSKNIKPMLLSEQHEPFDSPDFIFELKLDGIRCILYIDKAGIDLRNKENMRLNQTYPELYDIYKQVNKSCILDGELILMKDGKPDFYELQKRSMMTNPTKISFASSRFPVSFSAYDILYIDNRLITDLTLLERKSVLQETVQENDLISVSRYIEKDGTAFFNLTTAQNLEGIVAKRKDSKYYFDKRSKDWIKIKNLLDEDYVVCGYIEKENNIASLVLGSYRGGALVNQGHVTMGVSGRAFDRIKRTELSAVKPFEDNSDQVIWIAPIHVCTVQYMMKSGSGAMRQPVFKGLRDDKRPEECAID